MNSNYILISLLGFLIGVVLSIPAGGPTSIVIFTSALKGRTRYSNFVNLGACLADIVYIFISVYGLTQIYTLYKPFIPYVFLVGSAFIIYLSFRISKSKSPVPESDQTPELPGKKMIRENNGFITGVLLGFLNPGLLLSWMSSTLLVFTLLSSYGFDTGGLGDQANDQLIELKNDKLPHADTLAYQSETQALPGGNSAKVNVAAPNYPLYLSICYALSAAAGSVSWFYFMTWLITKFRKRIDEKIIRRLVLGLSILLFAFGILLAYRGITMMF